MEMNPARINVKTPKGLIYISIFIFILFNMGLLSFIYLGSTRETTVQWKTLTIIVSMAYIFIGWGVPIYLNLRVPQSISLTEHNLIFNGKLRNTKTIPKEKIIKISYARTPKSKELVYGVQYKTYSQISAFELDEYSGQIVYEWYYNNKFPDNSQYSP